VVAAVCCCRRGPAARPYPATVGSIQGLGPPHGAYAATISNGLCDHTRAMPRPVANIVRACVCVTLRTELATFGRTAVMLSRFASGQMRSIFGRPRRPT
jgi:hypothetical protein